MRRRLPLLIRAVLGLLLAVAGALKLADPSAFATEIANYQLLPAVAPYLAAALPALELVLGVALLIAPRPWRRGAAALALGLFVAFAGAVGSAYFRRINISCGCFGTGGDAISGLTLVRNLVLVAAAALLLVGEGDSQNFTSLKSARNDAGAS